MDIRCSNCGEPWDLDTFHEELEIRFGDELSKTEYEKEYNNLRKEFRRTGCKAFGARCNSFIDGNRHTTIEAIYDMMGDDLDGAAAAIQDAEDLGLI